MKTFNAVELAEIIEKHRLWLCGGEGGEYANLSYANLSYANLRYANLSYANLRYANLRYANLRYANLSYAGSICGVVGNMHEVKSVRCDIWPVTYTATHIQIGCQFHEIGEWWNFGESEISRMDSQASKWWAIWKPILKSIIDASPAIPIVVASEE